jgi:hypothetical protein
MVLAVPGGCLQWEQILRVSSWVNSAMRGIDVGGFQGGHGAGYGRRGSREWERTVG